MVDESEVEAALLLALKKAADPDRTWLTNAMSKLTIRFKDGQFKKTSIAAGDPPLVLTGVRTGKRAAFIFEFEPVDTRPYEGVEMDQAQAHTLLPGFTEHLMTTLGVADSPTFLAACARYRVNVRKRLASAAAEAKEAEAKKAGASYSENPLWGAFA